jgi:putative membrane protein
MNARGDAILLRAATHSNYSRGKSKFREYSLMIGFFIRTAIGAAALLAIASFSNGNISVNGLVAALIAALVLGVANALVKPILMAIAGGMTCVLSCLTLGLWSLALSWLVNALLFWVVGNMGFGFQVKTFAAALWGALALSLVNALATVFTRSDKEKN